MHNLKTKQHHFDKGLNKFTLFFDYLFLFPYKVSGITKLSWETQPSFIYQQWIWASNWKLVLCKTEMRNCIAFRRKKFPYLISNKSNNTSIIKSRYLCYIPWVHSDKGLYLFIFSTKNRAWQKTKFIFIECLFNEWVKEWVHAADN